ncbi:MAG: ABC transporter substrate-binding protein [Gammaproteobacteria bacterium]|nr:ABC transporter substrate-binding protein [Gammaproteobacteria bacterium]
MRRRTLLTAIPAGIAATAQTAHAQAGELVIGRPVATSSLDPGFLREAATVVDNIFDTLVMRDGEMRLVPGLAESWRALDDTNWEFMLRQGVQFHNGEQMNAEAVKFTIDRVLDPAARSPTISYIRTIKEVAVVDPRTVRITTDGPDPLLPARMSRYPAYIVPPTYVRQVGNEEFGRRPVGTGSYRLASFVRDDAVVLEANQGYWRGAPAIRRVTWRPIPEATARIAALLAGEVQLIEGVPADQAPLIERSRDVEMVRVRNGALTIYLGLRTAEPPLNDVRVRQALSLAIDRAAIVRSLLRGFATASGTQVGAFDFGYLRAAPPTPDPARARALLAEAGHAGGFEITMQAPRRYISSAEVGQAIAQQFRAIGVRVNLEVPEWSVYTQQIPAGRQAPIYMLGWGSTQTLDADAALFAILRSGEPYSTVSIPELDQKLDQSRRTVDPAKREAILHDIQRLVARDVPLITLYQEDSLYARRKNLAFTGRADARIPVFDMRLS